jgi:hypothetical protein
MHFAPPCSRTCRENPRILILSLHLTPHHQETMQQRSLADLKQLFRRCIVDVKLTTALATFRKYNSELAYCHGHQQINFTDKYVDPSKGSLHSMGDSKLQLRGAARPTRWTHARICPETETRGRVPNAMFVPVFLISVRQYFVPTWSSKYQVLYSGEKLQNRR